MLLGNIRRIDSRAEGPNEGGINKRAIFMAEQFFSMRAWMPRSKDIYLDPWLRIF